MNKREQYLKEWRLKNRDKILQQEKDRYNENRDAILERRKVLYLKRKDAMKIAIYTDCKVCRRCREVKKKTEFETTQFERNGKTITYHKQICNGCRYIEDSSDDEL